MSLSDIQFQQGNGGLGRPLSGQDFYSALLFYSGALPSGFTSSARIKKFLSVNDAINAGISYSYSDETQATATYAITAVGSNGNTVNFSINEPNGVVVNLGTYTKVAGDSTATLMAASIVTIINANTKTTGYSASSTTSVITITARKGLGIFLNSGSPLVVTINTVSTPSAGTITQFSGGVASRNAVYYYHISEFFRIQPQGVLYVGIFAVPGTYTFTEISTVQTFATGTLRQWGVWKDSAAFATADLTAIDTINKTLDTQHMPLIGLYGADLSGVSDISTLTDLSVLTANTVSAVISQDGGAMGAYLYATFGKSITTLGAYLGAVALAAVNEDIGWPQKFNISNGTECETLAFANGVLLSASSVSVNLLTQLDSYRYVFLLKYVGISGSFFCHFNMAVSISSDYAFGNDNRVIQKAKRGIYAALVLQLNSPLILNSDGTLAATTIAYLIGLAEAPLQQMVRNSELSAFSITIDPTQNVLSTSILMVNVLLIEDGVARNIVVPIGYTQSLSAA